jgi:hypothetical protein
VALEGQARFENAVLASPSKRLLEGDAAPLDAEHGDAGRGGRNGHVSLPVSGVADDADGRIHAGQVESGALGARCDREHPHGRRPAVRPLFDEDFFSVRADRDQAGVGGEQTHFARGVEREHVERLSLVLLIGDERRPRPADDDVASGVSRPDTVG